MAEQSIGEAKGMKRSYFGEEKQKLRDSRRRITLGRPGWVEWERQRALCGPIGHMQFVHHLLDLHKEKCDRYIASLSNSLFGNR